MEGLGFTSLVASVCTIESQGIGEGQGMGKRLISVRWNHVGEILTSCLVLSIL